MSAQSLEIQKPDDSKLPFSSEQLPKAVIESYDREDIARLVVDKLVESGINPEEVVVSGFDAHGVLSYGGFGDRDSTFAVGVDHMLLAESGVDDNATHSPVRYLEEAGAYKPAIGVFLLDKLIGSDAEDPRELLQPISADQLKSDHMLKYWATKDGGSLDQATAKLFLF